MRPVIRRRLAMALGVLVSLAIPLLLGWFPQAPLRAPAERIASELLGARVSIGALTVTPGLLHARADRVRIDADGWSLEAATIEAAVDSGVVFGAAPFLRSLAVVSPRITISGAQDGSARGSGALPALRIDELSITDAELTGTAGEHEAFSLRGLEARGAIGTRAPLELAGTLEFGEQPLELRFESSLIVTQLLEVTVRSGRAETGSSRVELSGRLGRGDPNSIDIEFETTVAIKDLLPDAHAVGAVLEGSGSVRPRAGGLAFASQVAVVGSMGRAEVQGTLIRDAVTADVAISSLDTRILAPEDVRTVAPDLVSGTARIAGPTSGPLRVDVDLSTDRGDVPRYSVQSSVHGTLGEEKSAVELTWRTAGQFEELQPWLGPLRLNADGTAAGSAPPTVDGRFSIRTTTTAATPAIGLDVKGKVSSSSTGARLDGRVVASDGASGQFDLTLEGPLMRELSASLESLPLASWMGDARGLASARLQLVGPVDAASGSAEVAVSDLALAGIALGDASGSVDIAPESTQAAASLPDLRLHSTLKLGPQGRVQGELQLRDSPVGGILAALDVPVDACNLTGSFSFDAPLSDPKRATISGRLEAGTWRRGDREAALARPVKLDLEAGVLRVADLRLEAGASHFEGGGSIDLMGGGVDAQLSVEALPQDFAIEDLVGRVLADVDVGGSLDSPEVRGHVRVRGLGSEARLPWPIRIDEAALSFEGDRFQLTRATFSLAGGTVRASGDGSLDALANAETQETIHLIADWSEIDLSQLAAVSANGEAVSGRLSGAAELDVAPRAPTRTSGHVELSALDLMFRERPIRIEATTIRLAGGNLELPKTDISIAGGVVRIGGHGSLGLTDESGSTMRADAEWRDLELAELLSGTPGTLPVRGRVSGRASVDGSPDDLEGLAATIGVSGFSFHLEERRFDVAPFDLVVADGGAALSTIQVTGDAGSLSIGGRIDLEGQTLDVSASGDLELRLLSAMTPAVAVSGAARSDMRASGPWAGPHVSGGLSLTDGAIRLRDLPVSISDVSGQMRLEGDRIRLDNLTGNIGGGTIALQGAAMLDGTAIGELDFTIVGRGVGLQYPPGLRSRLDLDLALRGKPQAVVLAGDAAVTSASFDLAAAQASATSVSESPLLRSVALDIDVTTLAPVRVRHDLARLEATGRLDIRGDLERPQPFGRFEAGSGGQIQLSGREFTLDTGRLTYQGSWDPLVAGTASTRVVDEKSGYAHDVSLTASGSLERPGVELTAQPNLSLGAIVALLSTGSTAGTASDVQAAAAGEQAASLLWSRLTRGSSESLSAFGIDEVSIQPELGLRELRPGARFTFAKRLTPKLRLLYSVSLEGPEARFFELEASPYKGFRARTQRRDDGSLTLGVGQSISFGGARLAAAREPDVRLRAIEFAGQLPVPEPELLTASRLSTGARVTRWKLEDAAARIEQRLVSEGHIEASVGARLDEEESIARISVSAGPRYSWRVVGMDPPASFALTVQRALDEQEALDSGRDKLLRELWRGGHPFASVDATRAGDAKRVELTFSVEPGKRFARVALAFPGATALSRKALEEACGGAHRSVSDPASCRAGVENAYRSAHFLRAQAGGTEIVETADAAAVTIRIDEGQRARLAAITIQGDEDLEGRATQITGLAPGALIDDARIETATTRIREHFYALGHPNVRVVPQLAASEGDYLLGFEVEPGAAARVDSIGITGLSRTRRQLVQSRLTLASGDLLDPREIARSERRLLETGLFSRAAITTRGENGELEVSLLERPRYTASYDLRYSDDRGLSTLTEFEVGQLLGRGLALGARGQVAKDLQELRGSLSLPLQLGGTVTLQVGRSEETIEASLGDQIIENERTQREIQLRHGLALSDRYGLTYGYRFNRGKFVSPELGFESEEDVAGLDVALVSDTRDDLLDPRRGRSLVINLSVAPSLLGATFQHVKGYARASFAKRLSASLTWAQGYGLGLGTGLGGEPIVSTERFRAGGANSLRGFDEGRAGPIGAGGNPLGGEALLVINQELRYRHAGSGLGMAAFYDVGNVYPTVNEMTLDVRHTLGTGLRYASPVGLLRLDLGWLVDAEGEEPRTRWHFSIGQAF